MMEILRCAWLIWRDGLERAQDLIMEMLDFATLGDIDWEDVKKAPMRI
jgi:hypothetical protein